MSKQTEPRNNRITEEVARKIKFTRRSESAVIVGRDFGVSDQTVYSIRNGKTWRWLKEKNDQRK